MAIRLESILDDIVSNIVNVFSIDHRNFYLLVPIIFVILEVFNIKAINFPPGSDGGIGRRSGLKIHRPQGCASSTLAPSTK